MYMSTEQTNEITELPEIALAVLAFVANCHARDIQATCRLIGAAVGRSRMTVDRHVRDLKFRKLVTVSIGVNGGVSITELGATCAAQLKAAGK
jgi:DNA-binding IscR family transcriptional regulator